MSEHDVFDRVLAAVHAATLDETRWPATSALIDEACGLTGNGLMVGEGPTNDVRALFVGLYYRGQRRDDLEREYLITYHPIDERVPRFRHLPARRLVHITDLYTAEELKTSRTYNEILRRAGMQDGLNVQLPGLAGSHIGWGLNDPVDAAGWGSSRITMVERLLPHIQQFVRVRHVLAGAGALGASLADLLATTGLGIIQLDGRGRIAAANDRALALLRTGEGLVDTGGVLGAAIPADDAVLQGLLTRALPPFGGPGAGGSMTVRRAADPQPLVVHLLPLGQPEPAVCTWPVAAVVVVVDPTRRLRLDPALVAAGLGLTPMESRVAVLLTEGKSLREVAAATGRKETTIRWHLRQIFAKRGIARQAEAGAAGAVAGGRGARPAVSPATASRAFFSGILVKPLHMVGAKTALPSVASNGVVWAGTSEPAAGPTTGREAACTGTPSDGWIQVEATTSTTEEGTWRQDRSNHAGEAAGDAQPSARADRSAN